MRPVVADLSHHNKVTDLSATGLWGIIHKSTQSTNYRDPNYAEHRHMAADAGMLWGAYHFCDSNDVAAQVKFFLSVAKPDEKTLLVYDFEDHDNNPNSPKNMSVQNLVRALRLHEQTTGTKATIYSGNRLKENIKKLSQADRDYVASHPLWLCQYGPKPSLPMGFTRSFLWQYTGDGIGPQPHGVPGIEGHGIDLNAFNGSREELDAAWQGPSKAPHSTHGTRAAEDDSAAPAPAPAAPSRQDTSDDDTNALPPFMRPDKTGGHRPGYDVKVEVVQRELQSMGYFDVGTVDGYWGGKTAAGIKAFFVDRGITAPAEMGDALDNALSDAKQDGFKRPIAASRANATPKDIAPHVESVRLTLWQRFGAKVATAAAGLGLTGSSLSSMFQSVKDKMQPLQDALGSIPPSVWMLAALGVAVAVWYFTDRAAKATAKDFNTGKLN
jgi:lysozyme